MSWAIPRVNFGAAADFSLGVEDELLLVDPVSHALDHHGAEVLARLGLTPLEGTAAPDTYAGLVELTTPICSDAQQAAACVAALRWHLRSVGATAIGSGLHPTAAFGDVINFPSERYRMIAAEMRGLATRTPTCALHVHVAMPDAETAIRACNALREHLPLLQALAANSPFWHGRDSGLASARAQVFRAFPRSEIPPAYASYDEYVEAVTELAAAGDLPDYTFLWWDIRPHPMLGTVEVRAMDAQSSLGSIAGLTALVQALAQWGVEQRGPRARRQVLIESSFRAARGGLGATLWHDGALRPAVDVARATLELARPYAIELGSDAALEEIERLLIDGNGASRQRAAFHRGGLSGLLAHLARETAQPDRALARA
jgi:glutamate---cysteine ligase / carboxylate-amine ligase